MLASSDETERREAAAELGKVSDLSVDALTALAQATCDEHPGVRLEAVVTLGRSSSATAQVPAALAALRARAEDNDRKVRLHALVALGQVRDSESIDLLGRQIEGVRLV